MGSKTLVHVAQPPTQKSNPTFLNTCQRKLESLGDWFHKLRRSTSNSKLEPKPEPQSYQDPRNIVRLSRPINPPAYDSLLFTGPACSPASVDGQGGYPGNGNNTSRAVIAVRKRDNTEARRKTDERNVSRDRRSRGRDAVSMEKRRSTVERQKAGVENKNEGHNTLKSSPSPTKSNDTNEGYNIRGSSAVLRGVSITDKTCKADEREKANKRRSTSSNNSTGEITALVRNPGHNAERRQQARNAITGNEGPSTFDNASLIANRGNKTGEKETASKRRKAERSSSANERNSPPGSTVSVTVERRRRGEVENPGPGHNAFNSASATAKRGSRTDKVDETGAKDKTSKRSKISKGKTKKRDKTPEDDIPVRVKIREGRKAASANKRHRSSNAFTVTRKGKAVDEGYETSGSNVAVAGGYSRLERIPESVPSTRHLKRETHEKRKSRKSSHSREGRSRTESTVTITTNAADGTTPDSTIRIKSRNGGRVLLLLPNDSVVVVGGGQ
ncbi:hypothetical protein C7212DRAFT_347263 [Tuber magnatum]|uniref:Uncharacterized protein n=1 Tax=Tuber magnatum TaxID=42249 RepID=A0A317SH95_9PEZI|nr:hypothetical protein C7212DRAFT_347263 [Tuber magnatum]